MDKKKMFNWMNGEPVQKPSDLDYRTTDKCDGCNERKPGKMMHASGATGRVCPVLFLCDECAGVKAGSQG